MIEYFLKRGGKYFAGEAKHYTDFRHNINSPFLCFLIESPDEHEAYALCKDLKIEEKPFKKFRTENRSLRYNFNPLIFTFTDYYTINTEIRVAHLLFIIKNNLLILVVSESSQYYREMFKKVIENAQRKKLYSTASILYEFLHQDAKENYDVIEEMDDRLMALEQRIVTNSQNEKGTIHEIFALKKDLIQMSKRLWASSKIIFTIKKDLTSIKLNNAEMALLDDIYDTFLHQIDLIETQKETVTDYLEIFTTNISNKLALISNELNVVMKKMAALTIIIMVPTLIAGIYGMNFHHMPELLWEYGYLFAVGLMAISAFLVYYGFHRKGWV